MSNNPQSIQTLRELFDVIQHAHRPGQCIAAMMPLVEKYVGIDWHPYRIFNNRDYGSEAPLKARGASEYNRIPLNHLKNNQIEFVIVTWKKGQMAPMHNHPEHGCIVKILQGHFTEFVYDLKRELKDVHHCGVDSVTYMDDTIGLHEVVATEDTVSLHIYSPPNYTPVFFR